MKVNNALILLWQGENVPDYLVAKIMEALVINGIAEKDAIVVQSKDENGIMKAVLRDALLPNNNNINVNVVEEKDTLAEAVKQSVIYIGERFKASLTGTNGNLAAFALELSAAYAQGNSTVRKAVEILATTSAVIPSALAKKYHFTNAVSDVINRVYQQS